MLTRRRTKTSWNVYSLINLSNDDSKPESSSERLSSSYLLFQLNAAVGKYLLTFKLPGFQGAYRPQKTGIYWFSGSLEVNNPSGKDENEGFFSAAILLKRGTLYAHKKRYDGRDRRVWRGEPAAEFQEWG